MNYDSTPLKKALGNQYPARSSREFMKQAGLN
jgi:hypothetical protein